MNLSDSTRARLRQLGQRGEEWMCALPGRLRALEMQFDCELGEPFDGGSAAYVARVHRRDGTTAVLKVTVPDDGTGTDAFARELAVLTGARGDAYVEVLAHDSEHRALLLEALGSPLDRLGLPIEHQLDVLGRTIARGWKPEEAAPSLPDGLKQAELLERLLTAEPASGPHAETIAMARSFLDRRRAAFDSARAVVIHADAHPSNVLSSTRGFKMIDPEGLLSMPEHDLGIPLREWNTELLAASDAGATAISWVRRIARASGCSDVAAIWEWSFIERVTSGLFLLRLGLIAEGMEYLAVANLLRSKCLEVVLP